MRGKFISYGALFWGAVIFWGDSSKSLAQTIASVSFTGRSGAVYGNYISPASSAKASVTPNSIKPTYGQVLDPYAFDLPPNKKINTVTIVRPSAIAEQTQPNSLRSSVTSPPTIVENQPIVLTPKETLVNLEQIFVKNLIPDTQVNEIVKGATIARKSVSSSSPIRPTDNFVAENQQSTKLVSTQAREITAKELEQAIANGTRLTRVLESLLHKTKSAEKTIVAQSNSNSLDATKNTGNPKTEKETVTNTSRPSEVVTVVPFLPSNLNNPLRQTVLPVVPGDSLAQTTPTIPGTVNPDLRRESPPPDPTPPVVPPPEITPAEPPAPEIDLEVKRRLVDLKIKNALSNTALSYPFILNVTDRVTFTPSAFRPLEKDYYFEFDLRSGAKQDPNIGKFTASFFPRNDQFYWVLPDNKIVFETTGYQIGLIYQGRSRDIRQESIFRQIQSYNGLQFVTVIPADLERLRFNPDNVNTTSLGGILSVVGQINNPEGIPAPTITTNLTENLGNVRVIDANSIQFPLNGGELFSQLAVNEPVLLQAFPTVNLQPLANTDLWEGGRVTEAELAAAGITFGNVLTGKPPEITAPVSSLPGIKVGQLGKFDNTDLLKVLLDRSLTSSQRRFHYLNSLQWVSLGIRTDVSELSEVIRGGGPRQRLFEDASNDWHRLYFSLPHQRSFIQYDSKDTIATFAQVFSNPGVSAPVDLGGGRVDNQEWLNNTLGLLAGIFFRFFNPGDVNASLTDAKEKREKNEDFTPLQTRMTSDQRRSINRRINTGLAYSNFTSRVEQVSGSLTFPSQASPEDFSFLQLRTGLLRRGISFIFQSEPTFSEGEIFYRTVRLSDDNFGLGFSTPFIPVPINQSIVAETLFTSPNGEQVIVRADQNAVTPVPIPTRAAAIAFDRLEIQRDAIRTDRANVFGGFQFLPSVELNFAGSAGEFNYSFSGGMWLNLRNNAIFNVPRNATGVTEPDFGLYLNALLNLANVNIEKDEQGNVQTITSSIPGINVRYNTSPNSLNPSFASLSYSFTRSTRDSTLFVTPSVTIVSTDRDPGGFLSGSFSTALSSSLQLRSLQFSGSIEMGNVTFYQLEGFNNFSDSFGAGLYYRNFTDFLSGSGRRETGTAVGVRVRYSFDGSPFGLDATVGTGTGGLESRLQGTLRF
ncbi:MAG: hypothetical protein RMK91_02935 [Pseudanabaenaceae cyanobacterium SKYGB_i_bin29]|nr:hypothetical protein [Pseudanabaenaceae cyanobacterium SKYG29]MDW8420799.1 hypothetical protein [Pseudanabaenaceae cyanobacterium SKYGB_i_bin29]